MKMFFQLTAALSLSLSLAACAPSAPSPAMGTAKVSAGIIGGVEVPADYPLSRHVVALYSPTQGALCTGTLMENNFVLTAAHCIPYDQKLLVFFGNKIDKNTTPFLPADAAVFHPHWNPQSLGRSDMGDIAIVHYRGTTPPGYRPLPLMTLQQQRFMKPGTLVMAAGYGVSMVEKNGVDEKGQPAYKKSGSGTLRRGSMRITRITPEKTEVVLNLADGQGICNGDSGGPAIVFLGGQAYIWGVSSFVTSATCNQFGVLTNAPAYEEWISQTKKMILNRMNSAQIL